MGGAGPVASQALSSRSSGRAAGPSSASLRTPTGVSIGPGGGESVCGGGHECAKAVPCLGDPRGDGLDEGRLGLGLGDHPPTHRWIGLEDHRWHGEAGDADRRAPGDADPSRTPAQRAAGGDAAPPRAARAGDGAGEGDGDGRGRACGLSGRWSCVHRETPSAPDVGMGRSSRGRPRATTPRGPVGDLICCSTSKGSHGRAPPCEAPASGGLARATSDQVVIVGPHELRPTCE